ncbi:MAG: C40 family peptidase [Candidatus Sumerlaeaceae bacterium]|nr:C40 family peptidase [Candidatus Sumerlaeaceae bacterium]
MSSRWLPVVPAAAAVAFLCAEPAQSSDTKVSTATVVFDAAASTSTDFLSDDEWRRLPREERRRRARASYLARIEPTGVVSAERLDQYIQRFRDTNVYDTRLYLFRVTAQVEPGTTGTVRLRGEVNVPQYRSGVEESLRMLGFTVAENAIAVLPDASLGPDRYGFATTAAATLRREPRHDAEQVNSVARGGWVRLLRPARPDDMARAGARLEGSWFLAQTFEGYLGFVPAEQIRRAPKLSAIAATLTRPLALPETGTTLPLGTNLVSTPAGYRVGGSDEALPPDAPIAPLHGAAPTKEEILKTLEPLMNVKYVWGGVTDGGIDCSGLSQFYFRSRGIVLPRDAVQQAIVGQIVAWGRDVVTDAQPGDLIFFVSEQGRVSHVAISLGGGQIVHSSRDRVKLGTLDDREDETDARSLAERALFARRVY